MYIYVILYALSFFAPRAQRGGRTYINRSTPLARVHCRRPQSCSFNRLPKHTHLTYLKRKTLTLQGNIERRNHSKNYDITFDTTTQCHQKKKKIVWHREYSTLFLPFKAYWLLDALTTLTFKNCTLRPHCLYVFCIYLRTNSDLCHLRHKLIDFYKRVEKCLLRDTNWVFILSSLGFIFIIFSFSAINCISCNVSCMFRLNYVGNFPIRRLYLFLNTVFVFTCR